MNAHIFGSLQITPISELLLASSSDNDDRDKTSGAGRDRGRGGLSRAGGGLSSTPSRYTILGRVKSRHYQQLFRRKDGALLHKLNVFLQDTSSGQQDDSGKANTTVEVELWGQQVSDAWVHQARPGAVVLITNLTKKAPFVRPAPPAPGAAKNQHDESGFVRAFNNSTKKATHVDNSLVFSQPYRDYEGLPNLLEVAAHDAASDPEMKVVYLGAQRVPDQHQIKAAYLDISLRLPGIRAPPSNKRAPSLAGALRLLEKGSSFDVYVRVSVGAAHGQGPVLCWDCLADVCGTNQAVGARNASTNYAAANAAAANTTTAADYVTAACAARFAFETPAQRRDFELKYRAFEDKRALQTQNQNQHQRQQGQQRQQPGEEGKAASPNKRFRSEAKTVQITASSSPTFALCTGLSIHRTRRDGQTLVEVLFSWHSSVDFMSSLPTSAGEGVGDGLTPPEPPLTMEFADLDARVNCSGSSSRRERQGERSGQRISVCCTLSEVSFLKGAAPPADNHNADPLLALQSLAVGMVEVFRGDGPRNGGTDASSSAASSSVDCWYRPALFTLTPLQAGGLGSLRALLHDSLIERLMCNVPAGVLLSSALYPDMYADEEVKGEGDTTTAAAAVTGDGRVPRLPPSIQYLAEAVARCVAGLEASARRGAKVECLVRVPDWSLLLDEDAGPCFHDSQGEEVDVSLARPYDVVLLDVRFH